jgi:aspartyl-tRNA(Asn)/glutamyl-tRNA(Gln) amidotransferase subunit B
MKYFPTIGLEVHAELKTKSKMFCGCTNAPHASEVNANVCPVCLAHPGTLPVPNKEAIEMVLRFGEAIGAQKADFSEFDRKNYFYPDIPKAYQISQYAFPFLTGGSLNGIELTRVHLEEDTARSSHENPEGSEVDFNRAGVPLMELVTEPVMHDAKTVGAFARELQLILRTLGISDANMERGEMRVEANISISPVEGELGTLSEIKNLNSFKSVEGAIEFEIKRQSAALDAGETLIQGTRGWDENTGKTFSQRSKETAKDYRYFPDPDISKIKVSEIPDFSSKVLAEKIPKMPNEKRLEMSNLGLSEQMIETLITDIELDTFFTAVVANLSTAESKVIVLAANYISSDLKTVESGLQIDPGVFADLIVMVDSGVVGSRGAKDLLPKLVGFTGDVQALAESEGAVQNSNPDVLKDLIATVLVDNQTQVAEYKSGKESVLKYLVGQGMKLSKGSANPAILEEMLKTEISK